MSKIKIKCSFCKRVFSRPTGRVNEAKKLGWHQYCSKKCQNQAKVTKVKKACANPACHSTVSRELNQFKRSKLGNIFCSSSCTAIVNNLVRRKIKKCPICGKQFYGERKYCSKICRSKVVNPNKKSESEKRKIILNKIKDFYNTWGRIPIKKEKPGLARGAQAIFGTWNKAIEAAGFEPNPIVFSKKFIANDGLYCDSFAEKIMDDWLYERQIGHERKASYPENELLSADFIIGNNLIEYFGLNGVIHEYDEMIKEKRELCKKYKLPLIEIFPKDLFPVNRLSKLIKVGKI